MSMASQSVQSVSETSRQGVAQESDDTTAAESAATARRRTEQTAASLAKLGLPKDVLPRHIAIIMDGNGRWAQQRDQPRMFGHREGAKAVRAIVTECARLEMDVLTLYSFSDRKLETPSRRD